MANEKIKISSMDEFYEKLLQAGTTNSEVSENSKSLKTLKEALKDFMVENDIEKAEAGDYTLTAFTTTRNSMDENKLMEIIRKKIDETEDEEEAERFANCIQYKPQIDEELVEQLVYDGILPEKDLAEALTSTSSIGLRFGKVKKAKN